MSDDQIRYLLRRVTSELATTRRTLQELREKQSEPIAIVGMACRYPGGVRSPEDLWQLVSEGRDAVGPFPDDRGWADAVGQEQTGSGYVRCGGFLDGAAWFDAEFFGMSPRTALATDPQQRLLLETAWETFERALIDPVSLRGSRTGVFLGLVDNDYGPRLDEASEEVVGHLLTGTLTSVASGRIAYVFGFEGPAVTMDTACSSSMVALHSAGQSLRAGECDLALAGGAAVMSHPGLFVEFGRQRGLAADGRCKAFADAADGTNWAEGVGLVLLERLSDARRNGHRILAVIRGSAINQDGASTGLSAPNGTAQQRVIRAALTNAGLSPSEVDIVEAHGTGTTLGDPIEAHALLATYGQDRPADQPLWLGSLKSNIGHAAAAAGVAGVIKMVQAIRYGLMPRSLHSDEPSSRIDWDTGAVRLLSSARPWPDIGRPRRAGVSAFGISGTNAHLILEAAPPEDSEPRKAGNRPAVVPWLISAKNAQALRGQAERLTSFVDSDADLDVVDVGSSLVGTRAAFKERAVVIGSDRETLLAGLRGISGGDLPTNAVRGSANVDGRIVFVFPGQGSQWRGMAAGLLQSSPVFANRLRECAETLGPWVDWSPIDVLRGDSDESLWDRVDVVQPLLWAMMVSLAETWQSFGVRPDAVVGHSQGEIAAACVAGVLSLDDAARVVVLRSKTIAALSGAGSMVSVSSSEAEVRERISAWGDRVSVAAVNSPRSVVLAGDREALDELVAAYTGEEVSARTIDVDYASHSRHVESIREELLTSLDGLSPRTAQIPILSTVDNRWLDGGGLDAEYWYANLRQPVLFEPAIRVLANAGYRVFIEVSPHPVLTTGIEQTLEHHGAEAHSSAVIGSLRRDHGGMDRLLTSVAEAYVRGVAVEWEPLFADAAATRVDLPTYAFQHQRYWLDAPRSGATSTSDDAASAELWALVEAGDADSIASLLGLDPENSATVLPALSSWWGQARARSIVDRWRFRESWTPLTATRTTELPGTWLAVVPAGSADHPQVTATLTALGSNLVRLDIEQPHRAEVADRLARAAAEAGEVTGVLSLLALDDTIHESDVATGLAPTLALVQAWADSGIPAPLWCLTSGAVSVDAEDTAVRPVQAAWWGFGRVAALEYPARWGGLVDLPEVVDEPVAAMLAGVLTGPEDQVAIRASGVYGRRLLHAPPSTASTDSWRARGTVLITGGTGGIGAHLARWVTARGAEHVVLASRRGQAASGAAELVAELRRSGADVTLAACDVGDGDALAELVAAVPADRPLTAVFHAAGVVTDDGPIDSLTTDDLRAQLRSKVTAACHLHELTRHLTLDAFVLFSSGASAWGTAGQPGYAAGNAFLEALAQYRRAQGLPATAVSWGAWADTGMANDSTTSQHLLRHGVLPMRPALAIAALQRILQDHETTATVTAMDWPRFARSFTASRPSSLWSEIPEVRAALEQADDHAGDESPLQKRLIELSAEDRRRTLIDIVRAEAAKILGHDRPADIQDDVTFRDMGFDSVTAVDFRDRLRAASGLSLPSTLIFNHPTPRMLTENLLAKFSGADVAAPESTAATRDGDPIVIAGMACRFPGETNSPEQLWQLLVAERDTTADFPQDRGWDTDSLAAITGGGGFLSDIAGFDAGFFGISPREALTMDPQQRLVLEVAWEALERAGIEPLSMRGTRTGVFIGAGGQDYHQLAKLAIDQDIDGHALTGSATSVLSGRISYTLGLEGPAITVDTACSSSLTALHLARQALRQGECDLAVAGGVTILTTPTLITDFAKNGALAADGRCKAFSDDADGIGCAEGVGVVVLERLSDALRNGHPVLAVVRGSAINQDGASNGLSAPNGMAQQRVIRQALADAGLSASDVDVVEAHGTGTALGDPIEAEALLATYGQRRPAERPLWLGSVKSNIGHIQAAAGIAGVIKTVLAMRRGMLPKTLHVDTPSAKVDWDSGAVRLLTEARSWPDTGQPRRAGVSSFGISGTNTHLILESASPTDREPTGTDGNRPSVVPWLVSARSDQALRSQADRLASFAADSSADPVDAAWSLLTTRSRFKERAVVVGQHNEDIAAGLHALADGEFAGNVVRGTANVDGKAVFVFPGHGSQWAGMATELLKSSSVFARQIAECGDALRAWVDWSLFDVLHAAADAPEWQREDVVQPVLWAVMVSLAELWRSYGVEPDMVVGHSLGEVAAAYVAGALSLEEAARVVVARSTAIMAVCGAGAMVVVPRSATEVEERISAWAGRVSIAAVNGPRSVVVSGDQQDINEVVADYAREGVELRRVRIDYAAHSPHIDAIRGELVSSLSSLTPKAADIPLFSTVEAGWIDTTRMDAQYWYANLRQPVRFERTVRLLAENGCRAFIEVSPHPVLTPNIEETLESSDNAEQPTAVVGTLRRNAGDLDRLVTSLAEAYVRGVPVQWEALFGGSGNLVQLPTYPFQRRRYWINPGPDNTATVVGLIEEPSRPASTSVSHSTVDEIRRAATAERPAKLREVTAGLIARALGADPGDLDLHEALPRLGLDSLITVQVRAMMTAELGITLPLVAFQEASGIADLAERILPMLGTAVEQPSEPDVGAGLAAITADDQARYEPFDLTDLQHAYVVGRSDALPLGQISAYYHTEVDLEGVDLARLADAFQQTVQRHDMLRAVITPDGRQRVLRDVPRYEFRTVDLQQCDELERTTELERISREIRTQVLDATAWPLFDVRVTKVRPGRIRLHIGFELLIADGWSAAVWFHDWAAIYHGAADRVAPLDITYRDYVTAVSEQEVSPETRRALEYWRSRAATLPPPPQLPLAKDPSTVAKSEFTRRCGRLGIDEWARFQRYAAAAGVSPSAALCAVYAQVVAAWSATSRFTLTVVAYNRPPLHPSLRSVVGSFTTTVLLEVDSTPTDRFAVRAERIQKQLWSDLEHIQVSGVRVLREINRGRLDAERAMMPVVFASTVNFAERKGEAGASGATRQLLSMAESGEVVSSSLRTPQVWLDHQLIEEDGALVFNWDTVDELFPEGMLDAMFAAYTDVLRDLSAEEKAWHRPASLLVPPVDLTTREAANATAAPVPGGLLHEDFLQRAAENPRRPAVIAPDRTLTYGELDRMSNQLGNLLRANGMGSGSLVGIVMEKGWEQVVAALAILKAGAAYVPIDAAVPTERLRLLLNSSGISVALTQSRFETTLHWPDGMTVFSVDRPVQGYSDQPLTVETTSDELAYVIYTSGSTGVPKGVMIEHRSALNTIRDVNERFAVSETDRMLGLSALNFDLSVYDIFGMLSAGGALVLPEPTAHREPSRWATLVTEHGVTMWNSVPKLMEMFVEHVLPASGFPLRIVMLSGDWIPVTLPDRVRLAAPGAAVWSLGGATEAAIWSIWYPIGQVDSGWASIPYGKPMRNQRFHVLNDAMQPCPVWVPGQLYIAGAGLARGYLNDEEKTRAGFIRHPVTGERLYATGDLGRYLPDGNLEFLGRVDLQVKIQGHRIELGEVEAALLRCRGVREAVAAVAGQRHTTQRLVGYVVIDDDHEDPMSALRQQLPDYLVPQQIVVLDELPLSANGKVDRAALPAPDHETTDAAAPIQPRDQLEEELARIWDEFFQEHRFGVNTSFFDLGGDSLLAVRLMARIQARIGRSLPVSTLFRRPTIELLAEALRDADVEIRREALVPIQTGGELPPLFFAHPVGGDVLCYAELSRLLGERQPFYGLQVPDLDEPLSTIPEMAAHYAAAIREAVPDGPYRLGGWSMGGVLALEIARRLAEAGETVEIVAVIDLVEPPCQASVATDEPTVLSWFARDLAGLVDATWAPSPELFRQSGGRSALEILHDEACRASVLPPNIDMTTLGRIVVRFTRNSRALVAHAPQPYPGRVRFFRGVDGTTPEETVDAWTLLFTGDAEVIDVPGDHYTMMRRPHLDVLVAELKAVLPDIR